MRIAALAGLVALFGVAGAEPQLPAQPGCGVYSFTGAQVADERHGRVVLAATVSSPEEALKIAHGVALGMTDIVSLDVIEVYVSRPEDARALLAAGDGDPAANAIARIRHSTSRPADAPGAWQAQIRAPRIEDATRGRRIAPGHKTLDTAQINEHLSLTALSIAARSTLCGIR